MPPAPAGGQLDPLQQRGERRDIDGHLPCALRNLRQLESAALESLTEETPARAIEPQNPALPTHTVEEDVEVPVRGLEAEPTRRARQRVEAPPHPDRLDTDEDPESGPKPQHAATTWSSR